MKNVYRFACSLALGALLVLPASMVQAQGNGRETGRCLRACLSARLVCWRQCPVTCAILFPTNIEDQLACTAQCRNTCLRVEAECNNLCTQPPITRENP